MPCKAKTEGDRASIVCSQPVVPTRLRADGVRLYLCHYCRKEYLSKEAAQDCAFADFMLAPAPIPYCDECGEVCSSQDIEDSSIIGSLMRCRSCIVKLAPELEVNRA